MERRKVKQFVLSVVVPCWSTGKTVGLKIKSSGKQEISCSIYDSIDQNIDIVEEWAQDFDEGKVSLDDLKVKLADLKANKD